MTAEISHEGEEFFREEICFDINDKYLIAAARHISYLQELDESQALEIGACLGLEMARLENEGVCFARNDVLGDTLIKVTDGVGFSDLFDELDKSVEPINLTIDLEFETILQGHADRLGLSIDEVFKRIASVGMRVFYETLIANDTVSFHYNNILEGKAWSNFNFFIEPEERDEDQDFLIV